MRHCILTCKNHPDLRWSCKEIAWDGHYNGKRHLFFNGTPSGKGMYSDQSGLDCVKFTADGTVKECNCSCEELILAPEDSEVKRL